MTAAELDALVKKFRETRATCLCAGCRLLRAVATDAMARALVAAEAEKLSLSEAINYLTTQMRVDLAEAEAGLPGGYDLDRAFPPPSGSSRKRLPRLRRPYPKKST